MHIRKYDFDYGRRALMEKTIKGGAAAGVLTGLWPMLSKAITMDATKAYPDELLSIEMQTKGRIKPGDVLTADNVEHVEHLLDETTFDQVKNQGRRIKIKESTTDVSKLYPAHFLETTLRNQGKAYLDDTGNVRTKGTNGGNWIGGHPFLEPQSGLEAQANLAMSFGRHNFNIYAMRDWDIGYDGDIQYQYNFHSAELQISARVNDDIWHGKSDLLRYVSFWFTAPHEQAGSSFLNTWFYDQRKFPDLIGYLPAFKRIREYPTNQRFEPLVPGITLVLSDSWAAGDPMLTWGNYKIIERKPMLIAGAGNWWGGRDDNWAIPAHGGPKDKTFFDTTMELAPEVMVLEGEPVRYPRAPVGKRHTCIDVRNMAWTCQTIFDRKGQLWKGQQAGYGLFADGDTVLKYPDGNPVWSWTYYMIQDVQTGRVSRFQPMKEVDGVESTYLDDHNDSVVNKYLTKSAMRRLGS